VNRRATLLGSILFLVVPPNADAQGGPASDPSARAAPQKTPEPPSPEVAAALAKMRVLYEQNRYQEASKLGEQLVKEHRDSLDAWLALASVHLAPDWPMRRDARAESASRRALALGGHRPDVVQSLATALFRQCKFDECLPLLDELIDPKPQKVFGEQFSDLLYLRAAIALRRDALDPEARARALADLERAIDVAPAYSPPRRLRAETLIEGGKFAAALADLEVAVDSAPGDKSVHYEMQRCLTRLKRPDEAKLHFEIWRLLNALTDSTATTNAPDMSERRELLRKLRELNPSDLSRRLQLVEHELELGDPDAAIRECDELLSLRPGWPAAEHLRERAVKERAGAKPDAAGARKDDGQKDGGGGGG
jgi:tetratricopeptide (TPR) repeat protein